MKLTNEQKKEIGGRLRTRRNELNMSQTDIANALGYSNRSSIASIEKGIFSPSMTDMLKLCSIMQVPLSYFGIFDDDADDFEFAQSTHPNPEQKPPDEIEHLNYYLYQIGERIMKTNDRLYCGELGEIGQDAIDRMQRSMLVSLTATVERMKRESMERMQAAVRSRNNTT